MQVLKILYNIPEAVRDNCNDIFGQNIHQQNSDSEHNKISEGRKILDSLFVLNLNILYNAIWHTISNFVRSSFDVEQINIANWHQRSPDYYYRLFLKKSKRDTSIFNNLNDPLPTTYQI
jgi:hypothetical protein